MCRYGIPGGMKSAVRHACSPGTRTASEWMLELFRFGLFPSAEGGNRTHTPRREPDFESTETRCNNVQLDATMRVCASNKMQQRTVAATRGDNAVRALYAQLLSSVTIARHAVPPRCKAGRG